MKRRLYILVLVTAVMSASGYDIGRYEGLAGRELADAVREEFKPEKIQTALPVAGIPPSGWPAGWWPAPWPGTGARVGLIIPEKWTEKPLYDLYNLDGTDDDFEWEKSGYPPGAVTEVTASGEGWKVGIGSISGYKTNFWEPADDRKGDVARRIMYVALIYPMELWHGSAPVVMADGQWPLLTTYGRELLGEWAANDPVDEREIAESIAIFAAQGNYNPFVVWPELYDYLWGEQSGQGYVPEDKRERKPLRGVYSRKDDEFIDLYSPYVGEGAEWSFDGAAVSGEEIDLNNVSVGSHIISYRLGTVRGKLKITVMP